MPPKANVKKDPSVQVELEKLENCANCRFYKPSLISPGTGHCRRYPPTIIGFSDEGESAADYPVLDDEDWCGEHQWRPQ